jgi:DNA-binding NtrC family response regulator
MFQITLKSEKYLKRLPDRYFDGSYNVSKNLTLNEAKSVLSYFKLVKIGNLLYNENETEIVGNIEKVELNIKTTKKDKYIRLTRAIVPVELVSLSEIEKSHIIKVNEYTSNKTQASEILGITLRTLYNKIEAYNIQWKD